MYACVICHEKMELFTCYGHYHGDISAFTKESAKTIIGEIGSSIYPLPGFNDSVPCDQCSLRYQLELWRNVIVVKYHHDK